MLVHVWCDGSERWCTATSYFGAASATTCTLYQFSIGICSNMPPCDREDLTRWIHSFLDLCHHITSETYFEEDLRAGKVWLQVLGKAIPEYIYPATLAMWFDPPQISRYFNTEIEPIKSDSPTTTRTVTSFRRKVATTVHFKAFNYLEVSGISTWELTSPVLDHFVDDHYGEDERMVAIVHLNSLVVWVLSTTPLRNKTWFLAILNESLIENLRFSSSDIDSLRPSRPTTEMWVTIKFWDRVAQG